MNKWAIEFGPLAVCLALLAGCSKQKQDCVNACDVAKTQGQTGCSEESGASADACSRAVSLAHDECEKACDES
jgi:hypothetical protein